MALSISFLLTFTYFIFLNRQEYISSKELSMTCKCLSLFSSAVPFSSAILVTACLQNGINVFTHSKYCKKRPSVFSFSKTVLISVSFIMFFLLIILSLLKNPAADLISSCVSEMLVPNVSSNLATVYLIVTIRTPCLEYYPFFSCVIIFSGINFIAEFPALFFIDKSA